jgi:hypothetical protein
MPRDLRSGWLGFRSCQTATECDMQKTSHPTTAAAKAMCNAPTESFTIAFPSDEKRMKAPRDLPQMTRGFCANAYAITFYKGYYAALRRRMNPEMMGFSATEEREGQK